MRTMSLASRQPAGPWRRAAGALAAALAALAPAGAWACGVCSDAALRRQRWETSVALGLVVALGAEAIVYVAYRLVRRRETGYRRAPVLFMAGLATAIVGFGTAASGLFMAATFAVGLLASFVRSLIADAEHGPLVVLWRVLVVAVVFAGMTVRASPAQVKTPRLVTLAMIAPDSWGEAPKGWVEEQLTARPDSKEEVERRLAALVAKGPPGPRAQDVELLRLHRLLGGDPAMRAPVCLRWGVTATSEPTIETRHEQPRPPDGLLSRLCFPLAER